MKTITDTAAQLRELANLHRRRELIEETIEQRILTLWRAGGWSLQELGAAIGKRASQVSRIIARLEEQSVSLADARRTITAMELVRRAQRGDRPRGVCRAAQELAVRPEVHGPRRVRRLGDRG